jgi:DNA-binding MarR family transcriptional regulator
VISIVLCGLVIGTPFNVSMLTSTSVCQNADMSQGEVLGPLDESVGYVLKRAANALRSAMEAALRPLDLTVPQYSCLEVLAQRPGLSNAELARAVFVTRQSMNLVLRGLQERGLVARPDSAPHGRARPTELTPAGRERHREASAVVRAVERRMLEPLSDGEQEQLLRGLVACVEALGTE